MNKPKISAIAAIAKNRALGKDNKLLFKIPEDQKRFKSLTTGHAIIMGRKTYESMGRPLPNRTNIIITRDASFTAEGSVITHSLDEALAEAKKIENSEIFIIGGAQIFSEALPVIDKLYLTIVDKEAEGDAFFPAYDEFNKVTFEQQGEDEGLKYKFIDLEKTSR